MTFPAFDLRTTPLAAGSTLLEASAGTGKTYTLVGILLRLLLEGHIERLDQALVVTFTVAATEELKNRLRSALRTTLRAVHGADGDAFFRELARRDGAEPILRRALASFDQVGIATMHGFCKRLLEEAAFESHEPFAVEFTPDPLPLLYRAAADALRLQYEPGLGARAVVVRQLGSTPAKLVEQYRLWRRHPDVAMEPATPDLDRHLAAIEAALASCRDRCDDGAVAHMAQFAFKKDSPFAADQPTPEELALFRQRLAAAPPQVAEALLAFAPSAYQARVYVRRTHRSHYEHEFFAACEALATALAAALPHLRSTLLLAMHERVELAKRGEQVWTFDDLLVRTHAALQDPARRQVLLAAVRARHTVALIDEFQDTDPLQYAIFADCFAGRMLFLVGDPKQAIYGFRGADLRTYLRARDDAARSYTLTTNHRSAAPLVDAIGRLFARNPRPFVDGAITMPAVRAAAGSGKLAIAGDGEAVLHWRFAPFATGDKKDFVNRPAAEELCARDVAAEAARLLRGGFELDGRKVRASDLAVLTRTNNQAILVQRELRAIGLPSAIGKAGDIFQTDELGELQRFLQAVLQPGDLRRVRAAMATRLWGLGATALQAVDHDDDALDLALEQLAHWRRLWLRFGYIVMQEQALVELQTQARYLAWHDGERRLTNLRQLFELLHAAEHTHRLSPEWLLAWLLHERAHQDDLDYTLRELRLESDDDAAQILTVHGSKGLEYEIVFCPFLWDAKGPRPEADVAPTASGHQLAFGVRKDSPFYSGIAEDRLQEELRLAYVALTRARRRCYVHWGALGATAAGSALSWLLLGGSTIPGQTGRQPDPDWLAAWKSRIGEEVPRWREALGELAQASGGTIAITEVHTGAPPERLPPPTPQPLAPPRRPQRLVRAHGLHSFSSLIAHSHDPEPARDEEPEPAAAPPLPDAPPRGIFAFARGPAAGQCLHTILERVDLGAAASPATTAVVRDVLQSTGLLAPEAHDGELAPVAAVQHMLGDLGAARTAGAPSLAVLCSGPKQIEWQFALPTRGADVARLADCFEASGHAPAVAQAGRLRELPPQALHGFLVGFVDLVVAHAGRHWVLDWKSNHLGNDARHYEPRHLLPVMVDHDYVLQYHLYVLALHRHLRARLRDYDYERDVGGVVYAFLRGVLPGSANGLFEDRVPFPLVESMDRWADGALAEVRR